MAMIEFPDVHDALGKQAKMIVFGPSGIGKTYQVTRIPNVLILDSELGTMSAPAKALAAARPNQIDDVFASDKVKYPSFVIPISHPMEIERVARVFEKRANRARFRSVVIDSMTYLYDVIYRGDVRRNYSGDAVEIMQSEDKTDVIRSLKSTGHQLAITRAIEAIELLRDVGCHMILTFHEGQKIAAGQEVVHPLLGGQSLLPKIEGLCDFAFHIEWRKRKTESGVVDAERVIRCQPNADIYIKNRGPHGEMLCELEPCDLNRILRIIETGAVPETLKGAERGAVDVLSQKIDSKPDAIAEIVPAVPIVPIVTPAPTTEALLTATAEKG